MAHNTDTKRIVIAGGSGFLGLSLAHHLAAAGWDIVILARHAPPMAGPWRFTPWDGRHLGDWRLELNGAAGLVNLAGRSVDCVKTPDHRDEILRSRVQSTRLLGQALWSVNTPPPVWVQMSTGHIYGDPPSDVCSEDSCTGHGLAPDVGRAWEDALCRSALDGQRQVILRTSFVVGRDRGAGGGALSRLRTVVRLGFGGRMGTGRQGLSWIHEADMNRLFECALNDETMQGVYIATAPHPVSQAEFMRTLRRVMHVPFGLPTPAWIARIAAPLVMRTDPELALYGRYLVSRRLREEGFEFSFPRLAEALADLCAPARTAAREAPEVNRSRPTLSRQP